MKILSNFFLVFCLTAISCSVNDEQAYPKDEMLNKYLSSDSFTKLGVDESTLDLSRYQKSNTISKREALSIPIFGRTDQFVIALINSDNEFVSFVISVEKADLSIDDNTAFFDGAYTAKYTIENPSVKFIFDLENSKLENFTNDSKFTSAKCGGMIDVLDCAARSIDSMRTLAWIQCQVTIITCLGLEMADCLLDGCANLQS